MPRVRLIVLALLMALLLTACALNKMSSAPQHGRAELDHAEQDLAKGVKNYEEGDYNAAIGMLQHALIDGLKNKTDQARAYKYLAFIHCTSGREKQCSDAFKKALEANPDFDLEAAETGHPVWGPVFRNIKNISQYKNGPSVK